MAKKQKDKESKRGRPRKTDKMEEDSVEELKAAALEEELKRIAESRVIKIERESEKILTTEDDISAPFVTDVKIGEQDGQQKRTSVHAQLIFELDKDGRNYISKLSCGKTVILHRNDKTIPESGVLYNCVVQEKDDYALAWIIGLANYPRAIQRTDGKFEYIEIPKGKPETFKTVKDMFKKTNREFIFMVFRKEIQVKELPIETKTYDISIKIKGDGQSVAKDIHTAFPVDESPAEIISKIEDCLKN